MVRGNGKTRKFRIYWISRDNILVRLTKDQIIRLQESYYHRGRIVDWKGMPWIMQHFDISRFMCHSELASGTVKRLYGADNAPRDEVLPLRPKRPRKPRFCPNTGVSLP